MILRTHDLIKTRFQSLLLDRFSLSIENQPPIAIHYPPNRTLGDLAITLAFELAKTLRKPPRAIAEEIADHLGHIEGVSRAEATPNGYVNIYLDRTRYFLQVIGKSKTSLSRPRINRKTIIEHTAINPNKAAHVGHLRNAALGDTLVRLLRYQQRPVETQNYIDDTGVQVADVVVGFLILESLSFEDIRNIAQSTRFDHHCWDLYARVTQWYKDNPIHLAHRKRILKDLEHGNNESAQIAKFVANQIVDCHLATMARLNVDYDLLSWEGDILRLDFWKTAFNILKNSGAVFLQDSGAQAGCWVMNIDDEANDSEEAETTAESRSKVIVRSDGTVTYIGKDIAYQFWKFGLLGKDFLFETYQKQRSGRQLWSTTADSNNKSDKHSQPNFGQASVVYNVIDTRQSYLQKLLQQALNSAGHTEQAKLSLHFSYEMVALSRQTAKTLGYDLDESTDGAFVEVSGRKGLGVKADDLLDRLTETAATEVQSRNPAFDTGEINRIASMIAVAAVRYFMIKYSRGKVIAFDIDEALSFEGESGPYLQYSGVRATNILQKLHKKDGTTDDGLLQTLDQISDKPLEDPGGTALWALVLEASRLDEVADQAIRTLELSAFAKYTFALAKTFNGFYHQYPVLNEEDLDTRTWRAAGVMYFRRQIGLALDLMGCEIPPRM